MDDSDTGFRRHRSIEFLQLDTGKQSERLVFAGRNDVSRLVNDNRQAEQKFELYPAYRRHNFNHRRIDTGDYGFNGLKKTRSTKFYK